VGDKKCINRAGCPGSLSISGCVIQSQNFNIFATHSVNGDVVFVQDQLTRTGHAASAAHARMGL
jgi:hypothetical protein